MGGFFFAKSDTKAVLTLEDSTATGPLRRSVMHDDDGRLHIEVMPTISLERISLRNGPERRPSGI